MRQYAQDETAALLRRVALQIERTGRAADADGIHDLRVSIRRLSRCLRVFSQFYRDGSWKKLRAELSSLMDLAGAVRDRDIAVELLVAAGVPRRSPVIARFLGERRAAGRVLQREVRRWNGARFPHEWRRRLGV